MRRKLLLIILTFVLLSLCGCNNKSNIGLEKEKKYVEEEVVGATNYVKLEMENGGEIIVELYPDIAPITVKNFQKLVSEGFYDGLIFHRVIKNFMIQGGDPKGVGTGGPGYSIKGEFKQNGVENNLSHTRGVISMARSMSFDSAGSQFFIMHKDSTYLDGQYAAFGKVVKGMDVVDAIAEVKTGANDKPVNPQKIKKASFVESAE